MRKLSWAQVAEIRDRCGRGEYQRDVAADYGVSQTTVSRIVAGVARNDGVDEIAVERACRGDKSVSLNAAEMAAAFRWLDSHGYSSRQIGAILGVSARSVVRWRNGHASPTQVRPAGGRIGLRNGSGPSQVAS